MSLISEPPVLPPLVSPRPKRLLLAFLVAPLAGPLGIAIGMVVPMAIQRGEVIFLLGGIPIVYLFATPVVYFFSFLLGLPAFLILHLSLGLSRAGLMATWTVVAILSLMCLSDFNVPDSVDEALLCIPFALGGAAVGYVFWWILFTDPTYPETLYSQKVGGRDWDYLRKISSEDWR